ncbi:MAG: histidine triad nucleotide-binding protein [Sinobacteraceae bacterium]|nr:histidine triad nucleotide-binding protein [Nevskia sp.]MDI3260136.1 histidine triad nucleotide-binding protein [Nevskiaceae bacterium]
MTASTDKPDSPSPKTLFQKIIDRELPGSFVYEDEQCVVIKDINPGAPLHLLVIPRKPIPRLSDATPEDQALLGHLLLVASQVAREAGCGEAFRVAINNGAGAGQSVFHLHLHVLAGRPLKWPPG